MLVWVVVVVGSGSGGERCWGKVLKRCSFGYFRVEVYLFYRGGVMLVIVDMWYFYMVSRGCVFRF